MVGLQSALAQASREGNCAAVASMVALVDVNLGRGQALYEAVRHGHTDVAKILIEGGADAGLRHGLLIEMAALSGNTDLLRLMLEHSSHVCQDNEFAYAERMAAARGDTQVMQLLITRGMDVASRGGTALQASAQNGHVDIVRMLLDHNADATVHEHRALCLAAGEHPFRVCLF
jgi:ankyrin repeat protein